MFLFPVPYDPYNTGTKTALLTVLPFETDSSFCWFTLPVKSCIILPPWLRVLDSDLGGLGSNPQSRCGTLLGDLGPVTTLSQINLPHRVI